MTTGHLQLRAGACTDIGRARTVNQDSHLLLPDQGLWVVADGMGGAQGGEVASAMVIDTLTEVYREPSTEALLAAMDEANRRIHEAADDPDLRGMGTTAVALAVVPAPPARPELDDDGDPPDEPDDDADADESDEGPDQLIVVNVGDSRAYLFRAGELVQLTEDHSLVGELVRDGRITRQEADVHPQRNIVTRVLGPYPAIDVDVWPVDAVRGDRVVLCSDGLSGEVTEDQISAVLRRLDDPTEAATELVRLANEAGGRDNITVVVVDVVDDGGVAEAASAALAARRWHLEAHRDLAGFSTAITDGEDAETAPPPGRRARRAERRAERKAARSSRTRITWRVLGFLVLLVAVLGGAFATIQWYGTSTYFVGYDGDEVAIFRGRPGGLLWIDPTLEVDTGILRDEVPAQYRSALEAGHEQSSLAHAERYVSNIERDIAERAEAEREAERDADTTTTTEAVTTTTAAP
jgi:serine/threonine protein phosphatase PrpC